MKTQWFNRRSAVAMALFACGVTQTIDNPHYWRATNFLTEFYEPRLAYDWLTSADVTLGFGNTRSGRMSNGNKTTLLNIYGPSNMQVLGINVPGKDLTNIGDITLLQLSNLANNDGFGKLQYQGRFNLIESNLCFTQNLSCGFFVQGHLPIRRIRISDISYVDLSPTDSANGPSISNPIWQNFLALMPTIFQKYGINVDSYHETGVGDLSFLGGWTMNYEDTEEIDYLDATFRAGALFPTGKRRPVDMPFSIANGYGGYFAFCGSLDLAAGWYDWLTIGFHAGAMAFARQCQQLRMRTDCLQTGFIKLAKGTANIDPGTIWEANAYIKADHVVCGLSLLLGYSFANKNRDTIAPVDTASFNSNLVNEDPEYLGWKMNTFNIMAEWDFATYECPWYPRVGAFYNFIISGKRIFDTNMGGIQAGIDVGCVF